MRDFLQKWLTGPKTSTKTKNFGETSSNMSKTKQFCQTSFKNGNWSAELTASYQCLLRFWHSICLNARENEEVIGNAAPVRHNHLHKPEELMFQNATPLRKSAPWPPNISGEALHLSRKMHLCRPSSNVPRLSSYVFFCNCYKAFAFCPLFAKCRIERACPLTCSLRNAFRATAT